MLITFADGTKIEGTEEQVNNLLKKLGYGDINGIGNAEYYLSSDKGLILIKTMHTEHLKNAILKYYRDWVARLSDLKKPNDIINMIIEGPINVCFKAMLVEFSKRGD